MQLLKPLGAVLTGASSILPHALPSASATSAAPATASGAPSWPSQKFETENFQVPVFKTKTYKGGKTDDGYLFLGMVHPDNSKEKGAFIVDNDGDLIWHSSPQYVGYYNFQNQKVSGTHRLTWWNGYLDPAGHGYGHVDIVDNTYKKIKKICFPPEINIVVPRPSVFPGNFSNACYVDKHESYATDRNSIIVTAYNTTQTDLRAVGGPKNGWVFDCLFYELDLDTNKVLFSWNALDHVPVTKSNFLGTNKSNPLFILGHQQGHDRASPWDFFHINSVQPIPGGYLVNSRMTWAMYKVNGKSGKVDWTFDGNTGGDFKWQDPVFFSWQHEPRVASISDDGKQYQITLFNDDNEPLTYGKNVSTGPIIDIDEKTMKARTIVNLKTQPKGPIYSTAEGSQQTLKHGHHLVGYGSQPYLEEYDSNNDLIYFAQFGQNTINTNASTHSYRTYRLPWKGYPTAKPKVVAKNAKTGNQVDVYMSWNGATELRSWNVYAGKSSTKMHRVSHQVPRKTFETKVTIPAGSYKYVMVEALGGKKKSLSKSQAVQIKG